MKGSLLAVEAMNSKAGSIFGGIVALLGGPGLMVVAVADSSFLTIPEANDVLIVLLSAGKSWGLMAYYVLMTTVGSITGCTLLYAAGRKGGRPILAKRFSEASLQRTERMIERYGSLTLLVPSLLPPPCPFKVFVLTAGVFRLRLSAFVGVVALGRFVRYSLWGILAVVYGQRLREFMQENLPAVGLALSIALFLVAGVVLLRFVLQRCASRQAR